MTKRADDNFYDRADAHIRLSNDQLAVVDDRGKVSASMLYGTARFNAWITALGCADGQQLAAAREEALSYFCEQYRSMLEDNIDDYVANFAKYMRPGN